MIVSVNSLYRINSASCPRDICALTADLPQDDQGNGKEMLPGLGDLQRKKRKKSKITMEVGGWCPGLTRNFVCLLENHPKIALNQY